MRISHRHKLVFLAYPRTGSTTIRDLLDPYADVSSVHVTEVDDEHPFYHHITARELKDLFPRYGWDWAAYRKMCVVRNPYDRVVSLYHHKLASLESGAHGRGAAYNLARRAWYALRPLNSFPDYVRRLDAARGLTAGLQAFICDADGTPLVDDVLMFERMREDLPGYLRGLGMGVSDADLGHRNASQARVGYREYYDDASRERVTALYRYEIDRFGYRF
jgi:hypothetical protein